MRKLLREIEKSLVSASDKIAISKCTFGNGINKRDLQLLKEIGVPEEFYQERDAFWGFRLIWNAKFGNDEFASGSINILDISKSFDDWEGILYFSHTHADSLRRDFKIIDYYLNEHACGIIWGQNKDLTIHYIAMDGTPPVSMDLDIQGYIEMMLLSKGYTQWQMAILNLLYGNEYDFANVYDFKAHMPILFPGWTWEGFVQKFEEVRLKKT